MDVFAQRKLLRRPLPGIAHFFVFWGFIVLMFTIIEAYGDLFSKTFAIPVIGHSPALGFIEDLFAVGVLVALIDLHGHPDRPEPGPRAAPEPLLRVAHRGRLGRRWPDLRGHRHPAPLPGRPGQHRRLPLRQVVVALRVPGDRRRLLGVRARRQHAHRDDLPPPAAGGDLGLLRVRAALQAHAHLRVRAQRALLPAPQGARARSAPPPISTRRR